MATAFLLWSSTVSSSSSQERRDGGCSPHDQLVLSDPGPEPKVATAARPPRARRGGKAAGAKRQPQRGLGVAQLERLRMEEQLKKIPEVDLQAREIQPHPLQLPPIYTSPLSHVAPYGAADYGGLWREPTALCYLPRCRMALPPGGLIGYGPATALGPAVHEQYSLDRYRAAAASAEGRIQAGSLFPELPSNQKMQCLSGHCESCARKKLLCVEINQGLPGCNAVKYLATDRSASILGSQDMKAVRCPHQRGGGSARTMEVKEYDFFPHNQSTEDKDSEFGDRPAGDASSSYPAAASSSVDLSLRLSGWN